MPRNFNILSIIFGLIFIGFGIAMAIAPPDNLRTWPPALRSMVPPVIILYGFFRLIRARMDMQRNKR